MKNINDITSKEKLFRKLLVHKYIRSISGNGLMLSLNLENEQKVNTIVKNCMKDGLLLFYFLFNNKSIRITPPLTISEEEIKIGCKIILKNLDKL